MTIHMHFSQDITTTLRQKVRFLNGIRIRSRGKGQIKFAPAISLPVLQVCLGFILYGLQPSLIPATFPSSVRNAVQEHFSLQLPAIKNSRNNRGRCWSSASPGAAFFRSGCSLLRDDLLLRGSLFRCSRLLRSSSLLRSSRLLLRSRFFQSFFLQRFPSACNIFPAHFFQPARTFGQTKSMTLEDYRRNLSTEDLGDLGIAVCAIQSLQKSHFFFSPTGANTSRCCFFLRFSFWQFSNSFYFMLPIS